MADRLGEILLRRRVIEAAQLQEALEEQSQTNQFLGEILIQHGYVSERQLLEILAEQYNTRFVSLSDVKINSRVIKMVPKAMVWGYQLMPIEILSSTILIAVSNPLDMWPMSVLQSKLDLAEVRFVLAEKADIRMAIESYYGREVE